MEGLAPAGHLGVQKGHHVSPSGNRTPVSRVTGGDTHHYTNEDDDSHKHTHSGPSTTPGNNHSVRLPQRPPLALHCTATHKTPKPGVNTRTPTRSPGRPPCRRTPVPAGAECEWLRATLAVSGREAGATHPGRPACCGDRQGPAGRGSGPGPGGTLAPSSVPSSGLFWQGKVRRARPAARAPRRGQTRPDGRLPRRAVR